MYTAGQLREEIDAYLKEMSIVTPPEELYKPIKYIMSIGGKRVRPVLMLMAYNLYREDIHSIYPTAAGMEIFHNYTLLHDDLMDGADMRRGNQTVHKLWNDNTAILSGDAMLVLAYKCIARCPEFHLGEILKLFNATALEVCEGQQYDVEFERRNDVTEAEYLDMIRLKTAVLLAASLKMGAMLGGSTAKDAEYLYEYGINLGIAFQLKDDFLDVYGDPATFGKKTGGDIICNKKTYMLIKALENANQHQKTEINEWMSRKEFEPKDKIASITGIYDKIGIKAMSEDKINEYSHRAVALLKSVSVADGRKKELEAIAHQLMYRKN